MNNSVLSRWRNLTSWAALVLLIWLAQDGSGIAAIAENAEIAAQASGAAGTVAQTQGGSGTAAAPAQGATAMTAQASGAAGRPGGALVISDFEGARVETAGGLAWVVVADEQLGGTSTASLTLAHPGAQGSRGAMRISFNVGPGFAYPFAGVWASPGSEGLPADFTGYRGLRFYARAAGGKFLAGVRQSSGQPGNFMAPIAVTPEWTLIEVPFDNLKRTPPSGPPQPFVAKDVVSIGFSVSARAPDQRDLEIDQVELYK